jgi:hypothetical protein
VSFDNHRNNDFTPYVFVTTDGGKTFSSIASNLPTGGPDHVHVIREDPFNRDLLYVGTSVGAYVSADRGKRWQKFMTNMPTVPVFDLKIHPRDHDLLAATHGRGFFSVNVASLEKLAGKPLASTTLFQPITSYAWGEGPVVGTSANGEGQGVYTAAGAQFGAQIDYYLPAATKDTVRVRILDVSGDTIATLNGANGAGVQHVFWGFNGNKRRHDLPPLSPADARDSAVYYSRMGAALDSVAKAGWDTALVRHAREMLITPILVNVNFNCGNGATNSTVKTDPNRPAEGGQVGSANSSGCMLDIGGSSIDCDKWVAFHKTVNPKIDVFPGACFSSPPDAPARSASSFFQAPSGDYRVVLSVGNQTYAQTLRVERVTAGDVRAP